MSRDRTAFGIGSVAVLSGGLGHPADATSASLKAVFGDAGLDVDTTDDVEAGLHGLDPDRHALLVVNALRFTMADPRYDDSRAEHAFSLSESGRATIADWHASGRPVLALHTAVISFDDWPGWSDLLGARWNWDRSGHPPIGKFRVECDSGAFDVYDECYQRLDLGADLEVVATSEAGDPLAWVRGAGVGAGRVAVDLLGHDARSLDEPGHRRLLIDLTRRLLEPRP